MAEQIDPRAVQAARQAALADPEQFGGAYALLLADHSRALIRAGDWQTSVQLLDLAQAFLRRAAGQPAQAGGTKQVFGTKQATAPLSAADSGDSRIRVGFQRAVAPAKSAAAMKTGLARLADRTLLRAVQALPSVDPLDPLAKSRLGRRLLQRDLTFSRDLAVVEEGVALCSTAIAEARSPGAELLANLGNALRARFELTADGADIDGSISYLTRARDAVTLEDPDPHAILSDLGDAMLTGFAATNETQYLDGAVTAQRRAIELTPPGHADRPVMLSNIGAGLLSRFERFADPRDLEEAEQCLRESWRSGSGRQDIIRTNLGSALLKRYELTGAEADLAEAADHLTAAADIAPAESPERLSALSTLAEAHWAAGRMSAARELLSEVVLGREAAIGAAHPGTLAARHNLATVMAMLGHCRAAAEELRVVLADRERVLGEEHPDTLATRHNLASALADMGATAEARAEFEVVVRARTAVLGLRHPDTQLSLLALDEIRAQ